MRFHFGVSISWYKLKKYIIPLLLGFLLSFGLGKITYVYAETTYTNFDTYYDIEYAYPDVIDNAMTSTTVSIPTYNISNLQDLVDYINSIYTDELPYYPVFVYYCHKIYPESSEFSSLNICDYNNSYLSIYLIPQAYRTGITYFGTTYGNNSQNRQFGLLIKPITDLSPYIYPYSFNYDYGDNSTNLSNFNKTINCMVNGNCQLYYNPPPTSSFEYTFSTDYLTRDFNNSDNYAYPDVSSFVYSSPKPIYYINEPDISNAQNMYSSSKIYLKKFYFRGKLIHDGQELPTYVDFKNSALFNYNNYSSFGHFYISDLTSSDLEDFELKFNYTTNYDIPSEYYISNLVFDSYIFGRVNHSDYFTYEQITCDHDLHWHFAVDDEENKIYFTFNNTSPCGLDLSSYDKFYIHIIPVYNLDFLNPLVINPTVTLNHGLYYRGFIAGADLFEYYNNFSLNNRILLTPNRNYNHLQTATVLSSNKYWTASIYDIGTSSTSRYNTESMIQNYRTTGFYGFDTVYGTPDNTGSLIFGLSNLSFDSSSNLYLFINKESLLSINHGNNDNYYLYDSNGNIIQDTIINDFDYVAYSDNSYDLSYYFNKINNFLDDLVDSLYDYSNLIQHAYNTLPFILRSFIDLVFILVLLYLTFKLIGK